MKIEIQWFWKESKNHPNYNEKYTLDMENYRGSLEDFMSWYDSEHHINTFNSCYCYVKEIEE